MVKLRRYEKEEAQFRVWRDTATKQGLGEMDVANPGLRGMEMGKSECSEMNVSKSRLRGIDLASESLSSPAPYLSISSF